MRTLNIKIGMENDAFQDGQEKIEVQRILSIINSRYDDFSSGETQMFRDSNGNIVGFAQIVDEKLEEPKSTEFEEFKKWLESADVYQVDSSPFLNHYDDVDENNDKDFCTEELGLDDKHVFYFSWTDGQDDHSCILTKEGIEAGEFSKDGSSFLCEDHQGEMTTIRAFKLQPVTQTKGA